MMITSPEEKEKDSRAACIKEPSKNRFQHVKPTIVAFLFLFLVITPFLLVPVVPGDKPPAPGPEPSDDRVTSVNEVGIVSWESVVGLVQAADGGFVVALTSQSRVSTGSDIWLVKIAVDGTVEWRKAYGWNWYVKAGTLIQTSDGGYVLAGEAPKTIQTEEGEGIIHVPWFMKTDASGNVEWNKTYDSEFNGAVSMVQTSDGGFVLAFAGAVLGKIDRTGEIEWIKNYKSNEEGNPEGWWQQVRDMVQTSDGGFALAGSIAKPSNDTESVNMREIEMWLAKTDSNGNMEWSRSYGGPEEGDRAAYSLVQTRDGGYAFTGSSAYDSILFVKTDSNGNVEWRKVHRSSVGDSTFSLAQTGDEGYLFAGYICKNPQARLGLRGLTSLDRKNADWSTDAYLIKTDSNGNVKWSKSYGEPAASGTMIFHDAAVVLQALDGGFALAGTSTISLDVGNNNGFTLYGYMRSEVDAWLMKTDENGNEKWKHVFDGRENEEWANDVIQTVDGGLAFTGPSGSPDGRKMDAWLVKTDGDGTVSWNRSYGGPEDDTAAAVFQTADGGFAITGYTCSWGAGNSDAWLVKTDGDGTVSWNRSYGGPEDDGAEAIIQTADGGFALAGYARFHGARNSDAWLIKTDENGIVAWNVTFGGDSDDKALDLFQLANGSFVLLGYHGQELITANCDWGEHHWDTYDHAWLVVVDEYGSLQREFVYEQPGVVRFHDIRVTGDSITVAGLSSSQVDWSTKPDSKAGSDSLVCLRVASNGVSQWERPLPYTVRDGDLVITDSGDFVLTGYVADQVMVENNDVYLLLAKMGPDGVIQWKSSFKVEHIFRTTWSYWTVDLSSNLIQTADGGFTLAGSVTSHRLPGNGNSADAWLARFDENGTLVWEHAYRTGGVETSSECYLCQAGSIILGSDNDYNAVSYNTEAARGLEPLVMLLGLVAVSITRKKKK